MGQLVEDLVNVLMAVSQQFIYGVSNMGKV